MKPFLFLAGAAAALSLSSCATYEPCTRDWFAWQADELQRDFARRNRGEVRRLRAIRTQMQDGADGVDVFAVLALASAKKDVERLIVDFRERVIPEARSVARTCELDQGFDLIVDAFLAEQGIDADLVRTLGAFGLFEMTPEIGAALEPRTAAGTPSY